MSFVGEGFYFVKDIKHLHPSVLKCFGCRKIQAGDLGPNEYVYAFPLRPFGIGYCHTECLPESLRNKLNGAEHA